MPLLDPNQYSNQEKKERKERKKEKKERKKEKKERKKEKKERKERKKERQKEEKMSAPQRASINTSNLAQVDHQDSFPAESASRPYDGADVGTRHRLR